MRWFLGFTLYRLLLPLLFIAAFPGWLVKMLRRGGLGSGLGERAAIYPDPPEFEPCGATHIHAVSVGEAMLALKLIREWRLADRSSRFVLATGTATGHAVALEAGLADVRVTYAPLDFPSMLRRYFKRFEPARIILIEGEAWPCLLRECQRRAIPIHLVNARLSPRSRRRYLRFANWLKPHFARLNAVALQDPSDAETWRALGVPGGKLHPTGSLKIDPGSGPPPTRRPEFQTMLDAFGPSRPAVLAASTHDGEELLIARAIIAANPAALPVIVPRHAERRDAIRQDLQTAGFQVTLRSSFSPPPATAAPACFVVDSTGELRDWTAHADAVIIGKSFLATGGQNPCEAVAAAVPLICGPHMENFELLVTRLTAAEACLRPADATALPAAIIAALDPTTAARLTHNAREVLAPHLGATARIVALTLNPPD
jgi:3-deoxy-D-manno-octulosonic-acid transferase